MPSAIDPTIPVAGNPTTASVRANFTTAKQEIEALQNNTSGAPFLPIAGGTMGGAVTLHGDPTATMHPVTLGYFQANPAGVGGGGGGAVSEAPQDGTLYGRQNAAWLHAVGTPELNNAINAAPFVKLAGSVMTGLLTLSGPPTAALHAASKGYVDSGFVGLGGATMTGPLILNADPTAALGAATKQSIDAKNYISQVGTTLAVQVVENSNTGNKTPAITGSLTPYNSTSDGFIIAARRLASPNAGGIWTDGAFASFYGPSADPGVTNAIILFAGNNTAGYKQFRFNPDGSAALWGNTTIGASNFAATFPLLQLSTNGNYSCIRFASSYGTWDVGMISDVNFNFMEAGRYVASFYPGGSLQLNCNVGNANTIIVNGGRGIQFLNTCPYGTQNSFVMAWNSPNAGVINISIDGGAVIHGVQPVSDARMKTDIAPSSLDCLGTVLALPLSEYHWLDVTDPADLQGATRSTAAPLNRVGMIAQDVYEIFPEGVTPGDATTDKLGVVWALNHSNCMALAYGAIQQLAARVATLEAATATRH
jgi:Chaperone of endosialidase